MSSSKDTSSRFDNLPLELQRQIWIFAARQVPACGPQFHRLFYLPTDEAFGPEKASLQLLDECRPIPSLLQTCRESWLAAKKEYALMPCSRRSESDGRWMRNYVYVHLKHDFISMDELPSSRPARTMLRHYLTEGREAVKPSDRYKDVCDNWLLLRMRVAVDWHLLKDSPTRIGGFSPWLCYMPNLKEITILVYPPARRVVEAIIFGSLRWAPYKSDGRPQLSGFRNFVPKSWRDRAAKVIFEVMCEDFTRVTEKVLWTQGGRRRLELRVMTYGGSDRREEWSENDRCFYDGVCQWAKARRKFWRWLDSVKEDEDLDEEESNDEENFETDSDDEVDMKGEEKLEDLED